MKKLTLFLFTLITALLVAACGGETAGTPVQGEKSAASSSASAGTAASTNGKKILVAYFSRTGENYAVGNIAKGNTHIVADMIAEMTGADTFEIKTVKEYPADYKETTEVAKREQEENARPELAVQVPNMADYDVVFLGYPIWWSDLPMPVYTFLESYDWNGKTIVPFVTSAGDVLTGKERDIPNYAKGAKILDGIGFEGKRVQENPDSVRPEVEKWLTRLGFFHQQ